MGDRRFQVAGAVALMLCIAVVVAGGICAIWGVPEIVLKGLLSAFLVLGAAAIILAAIGS